MQCRLQVFTKILLQYAKEEVVCCFLTDNYDAFQTRKSHIDAVYLIKYC